MALDLPTLDVPLFQLADYAGVALFAATGALAAARLRHDIVTFGVFAAVTGVGGGTLRDLLLGVPVFWVGDSGYLAVSLLAALAVWLTGTGPAWRLTALLWLDAVGLAAYAVMGAAKATAAGAAPLVALTMGVMTATFGGIVRDVIAGEPSILLTREIYATAALTGAATYVGLGLAGVPSPVPALAGAALAFAVRAGALAFGWTLPGFGGGNRTEG
ncbi:trimeric intracellular cation channel family protein [Prosthecomicrobium sp. N25]|uniref:trimeric intracellular cation channel family protein n=1 Tax=Prosthecomicrobium sp. N25 TaxID=3129254 RepID=UPI003077EAEC